MSGPGGPAYGTLPAPPPYPTPYPAPSPGESQGGSGPRPGPPAPVGLVVGLVVVGLVLLVAVGAVVMALGRGGDPPAVSIVSTRPAAALPEATADPTATLDNQITLTAAAGWETVSARPGSVVLRNAAGDLFSAHSLQLPAGTAAEAVLERWQRQLAAKLSGVRTGAPSAPDPDLDLDGGTGTLDAVTGTMTGILATSQGSRRVDTESVVSVRRTDGVTVIATVRHGGRVGAGSPGTDYLAMVRSMLRVQAAG